MKILPWFLGLLGLATPLSAAYIDDTLHYQGRVSVQGVNFSGPGQFKFALVDAGTPFGSTATATATVDGDAVTAVNVDSSGANYLEPPFITFSGPGSGATAVANLDLGIVSSITVTNGGSGYTTPPVVTIAPPPAGMIHSSYWSNDGTSTSGDEPQAAVEIPVINGLYSVQLGGTAPDMTRFDSEIFAQKLHLRVWFNDGSHGFQQLTPDQPLATAPYALQARLAESVAPGAIGGAQLASGAAAANLGASGQSGVASGGVILSATENPALVAAGYMKLPAVRFNDVWAEGSSAGGPLALTDDPVCVWTGTHVFVWAGGDFGGGLYNPATNTWAFLPGDAPGAPPGRRDNASAVWTGSEVILWGGNAVIGIGYGVTGDGGRYNPATNTWTPLPSSAANVPTPRHGHTAVWTGSKMIVWGGQSGPDYLSTGGIYDPQANGGAGSWTATSSTIDTPSGSANHTAVWTGSEMVIWGGTTAIGVSSTGKRFTLPDGTPEGVWSPLFDAALLPPEGRRHYTMIWTGTHLVMWGGRDGVQNFANGYRYVVDQWVPLATTGDPPTARFGHSAVWTGTDMIIWGGSSDVALASGSRYRFSDSRWEKLTDSPESARRSFHNAVWTGSQMQVCGGTPNSTLWSWTPERQMHLYQRP